MDESNIPERPSPIAENAGAFDTMSRGGGKATHL